MNLIILQPKCNIAGIVEENAEIPGLSSRLQRGSPGLVPTTQMIRIVFALCYDEIS